jgi:serine/threonine-protein kinase
MSGLLQASGSARASTGESGAGLATGGLGGPALQVGESLLPSPSATRYEIIRSLGTGGWAQVFLARRIGPEGFERPVALKCILSGLDVDEATRRAFLFEARLGSKLRHPNIAEAYDLAQVGERYFLVLEYVDGVTLATALRTARAAGARFSEGFSCRVVANLADALHHAHGLEDDDGNALGIVHRDVKPSNVMLSRAGVVKLLDFGIAFARVAERDRTRTGQFKGTIAYASPEQALGEGVDRRSDLFSLGLVLVELLTGIRVFEEESDVATLRRMTDWNPEEVRGITGPFPPELAAVCAKALARRPDDRYRDGAAFSRALRQYLLARGISYEEADCAAELRALGLFASSKEREADENGAETSSAPGGAERAEISRELPPTRPVPRPSHGRLVRAAAGSALLLAMAIGGDARPWRHSPPPSGPVPTTGTGELPHETPGAAKDAAAPAPSGASSFEEPVVRPKRAGASPATSAPDRATVGTAPAARGHAPARATEAGFADRATVGSPSATLPRGTLVPVKLLQAIAPGSVGRADAVVTEDVAVDGVVLVPRTSTVSCRARPPAEGRVPLACDAVTTPDRVMSFSGVAVGEGQHVGLRWLDEEIAAGTPFVVYVSSPAALR